VHRWVVLAALALLSASADVAHAAGVYAPALERNYIWQFDSPGGALNWLSPSTVPATAPVAMAVAPDGKHAYVTQFNESAETDDIRQFDIDAAGHLVASANPPVATGSVPTAIAISPDGRNAYVANADATAGGVWQYDIAADGRLTPKGVPVGTAAADIVVFDDGGNAVAVTDAGLQHYNRASDGQLTPTLSTDRGDIRTLIARPGSSQLFVAGEISVGAFGTQPTGAITELGWSAVGPCISLAASPDGRYLYVARENNLDIRAYRVAANGLTGASLGTVRGDSKTRALTLSADDRSLYALQFDGAIAQYDIAADGRITPKNPPRVPAPGTTGIVAAPNQGPTAAVSATVAPTGEQTRFDASGSHDSDGTVARYDWDFGDGTVLSNGGATPTHTFAKPGDYLVKVAVTDDGGCSTKVLSTGQTAMCNGGPAAETALVARVAHRRLAVSKLSLKGRWRVAPRGVTKDDPDHFGTTIRWEQSRPAPVRLRFERVLSGRRVGKRCVKPTRANRGRKPCTRLSSAYSVVLPGTRGANRRRFLGWPLRPGKVVPLKAGRYFVSVTASDSGERAVTSTRTTVLAARKR